MASEELSQNRTIFKESDISRFDRLPNCPLDWFQVSDVSIGQSELLFTTVATGARDRSGNIFIVDISHFMERV